MSSSPSSPALSVDDLKEKLRMLRSAHAEAVAAKVDEISAIGEELVLVNSDIEATEKEERKCKRRLHLAKGTSAQQSTASYKESDAAEMAKHHEKNLVENILSSLLEFNELRSKRR